MLKCWKWAGKGTKRLLKSGDSKVTLLALRSAVRKLGFKSEGIVLSVKELSSVMLPVILHLRSEHYVVLFHIENDIFFIADPLVGIREYTMKDLYKYWTVDNTENGHVLTIDPYVNFESTT